MHLKHILWCTWLHSSPTCTALETQSATARWFHEDSWGSVLWSLQEYPRVFIPVPTSRTQVKFHKTRQEAWLSGLMPRKSTASSWNAENTRMRKRRAKLPTQRWDVLCGKGVARGHLAALIQPNRSQQGRFSCICSSSSAELSVPLTFTALRWHLKINSYHIICIFLKKDKTKQGSQDTS